MERRESRVESQNCFRSPPAGTRLSTLRSQLVSDPCGIRTQPNQRERLTTSPEVERAGVAGLWPLKHGLNKWKLFAACSVSQARHKTQSNCQHEPTVGREVLEPSSPSLQLGATPSQLPAQQSQPFQKRSFQSRDGRCQCPSQALTLTLAASATTARTWDHRETKQPGVLFVTPGC